MTMLPAVSAAPPATGRRSRWTQILDPDGMGIAFPVGAGLVAFALFFVGFGGWAALAELERAVVAVGTIIVESNRKSVQHLEGGILADILVRDGDEVQAGDMVIRLDDTQGLATMQMLSGQLWASQALEARLAAERDGLPEPRFPASLTTLSSNPVVAETVGSQRTIFRSRAEAIESQTRILRQGKAQLAEQVTGLRAQIEAQNRQISLIGKEIASVEFLVEKGLERQPRLLALQRQESEIEGQRAQNAAQIARAQQAMGETDLRIIDLRAQFSNDVVQKLRDEQMRIQDLEQRLAVAKDTLDRTLIRAPVSGKVVGLSVFTVGGIVAPREPLMEIVPHGDKLVVDVQVSPLDIDVVQPGKPVQIRFPGLNQRTTPSFDGKVAKVSADRLTEQRSGQGYYTAQIVIDGEQLSASSIELKPGLPVEAMIVAGSRTPLRYLLDPILAGVRTALRED